MQFYPKLCAFNIQWREKDCDGIESYIAPRGTLTKPGMPSFYGDHSHWYEDFPKKATSLQRLSRQ